MRKMKEVGRFAWWCFGVLGVPPCKIVYEPGWLLCDETGTFYGVYIWDDEHQKLCEIHVAGRIPKYEVMGVLAHEIVHHHQHTVHGLKNLGADEREEQAREMATLLLHRWLERGGYTVHWRDWDAQAQSREIVKRMESVPAWLCVQGQADPIPH